MESIQLFFGYSVVLVVFHGLEKPFCKTSQLLGVGLALLLEALILFSQRGDLAFQVAFLHRLGVQLRLQPANQVEQLLGAGLSHVRAAVVHLRGSERLRRCYHRRRRQVTKGSCRPPAMS